MSTSDISSRPVTQTSGAIAKTWTDPWTPLILRLLRGLEAGKLQLVLPDGRRLAFAGQEPGPAAEVVVRQSRVMRRLLLGGDLGFAEAYLDGDWDSPDLSALFELAACNRDILVERTRPNALGRLMARLAHGLNRNSRRGSRRNIAAHYDLGNDFYAAWLDGTMSYSAAIFSAPDEALEAAQKRKYRRICRELDLRPGQHVLEIGCGWGGFAEVAASEFGARVTGITLSREQLAFAQARMAAQGLSDLVELRLQDYRDLQGHFDHIVSIEMVEAVGERYWSGYFDTLRTCLKPGGRAVLQSILIGDAHFEGYRRSPDFIQRYIFPGGMLPTQTRLVDHADVAGLRLADVHLFGIDYAETLARWHAAFERNWPQIRARGFDGRFRRLWRYYLAYCEGGFRGGAIDVGQFTLVRDA